MSAIVNGRESGCGWLLGGHGDGELCGADLSTVDRCAWHRTCEDAHRFMDAHRGPNPPDTPTAGESGQAATGATSAPVAADIAADYPWLVGWSNDPPYAAEAAKALAEIEAGRNAIAALRMFRRDLLVKDRYTARLEAELAEARQHEAHWRKEADSWKESVDNLTRQVDDLKDAIDTADTAVTEAFATMKGYAL